MHILPSLIAFCTFAVALSSFQHTQQELLVRSSSEVHQLTSRISAKIIVGYANWNECDDKLITAVQQGVNVLIWFSVNLLTNATTGLPVVTGGPQRRCVESIKKRISDLNLDTVHLISIGGWDSPHPDTTNSALAVYENWKEWNNGLYDGFDWDIEGNDDTSSPYNHFTVDCLDLMGEMSQRAKADGFIVSMAPAESYLDMTTSAFDLDLNHTYPEWETLQPTFAYHGHNVYAYLIAKFGATRVGSTHSSESFTLETFDFITVQLYEGYSHAEYNTTILSQPASDYIINFVERMSSGWDIDFGASGQVSLPTMRVSVPVDRLVIGLANGWAGDGKFILVYPDQLEIAYNTLKDRKIAPKGFGFWDIADEGKSSSQRPDEPVWLAQGLNGFMHTR